MPQKGFYWSVLAAVFTLFFHLDSISQSRQKAKPATIEHDTLTEWELINGSAIEVGDVLKRRPRDERALKQRAELAIRSARGAERALAEGNALLFDSYRSQIRGLFRGTRWRLGRMAKEGRGAAAFALGVVEVHGILEAADLDKACRHFAEALEKGFGGARFRLAQCLESTDAERAARLMREVADAGHPVASELAGRACLEAKPADAACAYERLTVAAAAGRPSAQSLLAWMYTQGVGGRSDAERAARLYLMAAKAGDTAAQNNVGELYETGRGVAADPRQALDWYRKAAAAGFAPAQFNLGRLYAAGKGVEKNLPEARGWLERADKAGIVQARQVLEWINREPVDAK